MFIKVADGVIGFERSQAVAELLNNPTICVEEASAVGRIDVFANLDVSGSLVVDGIVGIVRCQTRQLLDCLKRAVDNVVVRAVVEHGHPRITAKEARRRVERSAYDVARRIDIARLIAARASLVDDGNAFVEVNRLFDAEHLRTRLALGVDKVPLCAVFANPRKSFAEVVRLGVFRRNYYLAGLVEVAVSTCLIVVIAR